ncbi:MAG: PP2C family protein-serine/threonine phosphatase [Acidobacteria bacterium]|nr:PP2C family protein-serine/threonine phosphatase [Acidobacteriota bacterium]
MAGNTKSGNAHQAVRDFWQRVTDGLELQELWKQFQAEARAGYALYSREVSWEAAEKEERWRRPLRIAREFFWAILLKLTPARRVLLIVAIALLLIPPIGFRWENVSVRAEFHGIAAFILLVLLGLELAERVTMKRDLEIAREIQRWLVPEKPPAVPGYDIAFATRPANTVAGDYYDVFASERTDGGASRLLLVVADVAGKGVPAALLMATFRASLHALAAHAGSFEELVGLLNRAQHAHSLGGLRFTTAFCAELDPAARILRYINAGHNPPVLRRASGAIERLEEGGLPLGIEPAAGYEAGSAMLSPRDLLLIFTDGLIEAVSKAGEEYGEDRLLEWLRNLPEETAADTLRRLMASIDSFAAAAPQHDDITCLVLRST